MLKNSILKKFFAIALIALFSLSVFALNADIAGKYTGSATLDGAGTLNIKAEIVEQDGKYSGSIDSDMGSAAITGGSFAENKLTLTLDAGGDSATMTGTVAEDGKIAGDISGAFKGSFELMKEKPTR